MKVIRKDETGECQFFDNTLRVWCKQDTNFMTDVPGQSQWICVKHIRKTSAKEAKGR